MTIKEMRDMTDDDFYQSVMNSEDNKTEDAINNSQYSLEEQILQFSDFKQDNDDQKLLVGEICALM